eukprot:403371354
MTFEERLKLKQKTGYDVVKKEDVLMRKEKAEKLTNKVKLGKKMPREKFSKLQVSVLRPLNMQSVQTKGSAPAKLHTHDPRFDARSGNLNEGLFKESYAFIKEVQDERFKKLGEALRKAKKEGDKDKAQKLRDMIGDEKSYKNKGKQKQQEKEVIKEAKKANRERVEKGLEPVYLKKRDIKEMKVKQKFEKLDKEGKLEQFIMKKQEEKDRLRK